METSLLRQYSDCFSCIKRDLTLDMPSNSHLLHQRINLRLPSRRHWKKQKKVIVVIRLWEAPSKILKVMTSI